LRVWRRQKKKKVGLQTTTPNGPGRTNQAGQDYTEVEQFRPMVRKEKPK